MNTSPDVFLTKRLYEARKYVRTFIVKNDVMKKKKMKYLVCRGIMQYVVQTYLSFKILPKIALK